MSKRGPSSLVHQSVFSIIDHCDDNKVLMELYSRCQKRMRVNKYLADCEREFAVRTQLKDAISSHGYPELAQDIIYVYALVVGTTQWHCSWVTVLLASQPGKKHMITYDKQNLTRANSIIDWSPITSHIGWLDDAMWHNIFGKLFPKKFEMCCVNPAE